MKPRYELADVIGLYGKELGRNRKLSSHQLNTLHALQVCRTAALGGHIDGCDNCGHIRISYNSCRNRHCPKCQATNRERWIADRQADLLPVNYFHVVFTLPHQLNALCLQHAASMYNLLFRAAWETMETFTADKKHLGAQTGMIAILHSWGQTLSLHPHIHCIVPAGGIDAKDRWKKSRSQGKYLFAQKAISQVFRAKFVSKLRKWAQAESITIPQALFDALFAKKWVVDAQQPFLGPKQVLEYLGRYTHKIAISNHRLLAIDNEQVRFRYKDYRQGGKSKEMSLSGVEFLRRFSQHILPRGFVRIRHYGILSCRNKRTKLKQARIALGVTSAQLKQTQADWKTISRQQLGFDPDQCPYCQKGKMIRLLDFAAGRDPPSQLLDLLKHQIIAKKQHELG